MLASASPRRLELLGLADLDPLVRPADVDESPLPGESPEASVARLAGTKATAVAKAGEVVLAADTTVVIEGESLGKPDDASHAVSMLRRLAGRAHTVSTGVAVRAASGALTTRVVTTEVVLTALSEEEIHAYIATGEPFGKAGAYAIQGRAAVLVERLTGSWTNVVGLPMVEALRMLRAAGVARLLRLDSPQRSSGRASPPG